MPFTHWVFRHRPITQWLSWNQFIGKRLWLPAWKEGMAPSEKMWNGTGVLASWWTTMLASDGKSAEKNHALFVTWGDRGSKAKATNKCQRPSTTAVRFQHQLKRGASLRKRPTRSAKGAMGRPWQPGHLQKKACVGGRHAHFPAAEQWPRPAKNAEPLHCCSVQCGQHGERQVSARCSW